MTRFTLVRHSGYAVGGDPAFEDAVELVEVTENQTYHVRAAGGLLLATLAEAQAAERAANFPAGTTPDRPHAAGHFSSVRVGRAEIYVPRDAAATQ